MIASRKGGLVGWFIFAFLVMFILIFYGIFGDAQADKPGHSCEMRYGVLCFKWSGNETSDAPFRSAISSDVGIVAKD
ncbi:MAG: hypothetical protein ACOC32_02905 [Nanoarchaeota archaeon]